MPIIQLGSENSKMLAPDHILYTSSLLKYSLSLLVSLLRIVDGLALGLLVSLTAPCWSVSMSISTPLSVPDTG